MVLFIVQKKKEQRIGIVKDSSCIGSDYLDRRAAGRTLKTGRFMDQERKDVLKAGIQSLVHMRELREGESQSKPETNVPKSSTSSAHPDKCKVRLGLIITKHGLVNFFIFNT